jgi:hypothetical protein
MSAFSHCWPRKAHGHGLVIAPRKSIPFQILGGTGVLHGVSAWLPCVPGTGKDRLTRPCCTAGGLLVTMMEITMSTGNKSMFRSAFDAMVDARQRQAKSYVNGALLMLDDETLKARGLDRKTLTQGRTSFPIY